MTDPVRRVAAMVGLELMNAPHGPAMKKSLHDAAARFDAAASMCRGLADGMPAAAPEQKSERVPISDQPKTGGRPGLTDEELKKARSLVQNGVPVAVAAREIGRAESTVYRAVRQWIRKNGEEPADPDAPGTPVRRKDSSRKAGVE